MTRQEAQSLERAIGADIDRTPALRDAVLVGGVEKVLGGHTSSTTSRETSEYRVRLLLVHPGDLPDLVASRAEWDAVKTTLLGQRHLSGSRSL